ncbi:MAG TPA: hypothetical protein VGG44_11645 [Tepidisphaeraceae bacterium]
MSASSRRVVWLILWLALATGAGVGIVLFFGLKQMAPSATRVAQAPQSAPSTMAATTPSTRSSMRNYGQVLHADLKNYPDTQPWAVPVDLSDAAHIILNEPTYVCSRGDLWITRPDADPLPQVLARAPGESEHIVDRAIAYIIWSMDRRGAWTPSAVCKQNDGYEIVGAKSVQAIPWHRAYRWDAAMTWDDNGVTRLIVPTDEGVSIIDLGPQLSEEYCPLMDAVSTTRPSASPAVLFDTRGLLAWIPADDTFSGTRVARFLNGKWAQLDSSNWPGDIIYLVPLLEWSVLQIRHERGAGALTFVSLDNPDVDEKQIGALVDQLGDDDPDKRTAAYQKLSQYGPNVNPILQRLLPNAAPESQSRIRQLLVGATLGGMAVNGNQLVVKARLRDGGMVFLAPQGVTIPQEGQEPKVVAPDYLAVRPGRAAQELPAAVVEGLAKPGATVTGVGEEWVVSSPETGPMRFLPPDELDPLLRGSERNFSRLVAIDGRGRWVFRDDSTKRTLLLDPTVPDPRPRLAIWFIDTGTSAGWSKSNWPAIQKNNSRWIIDDHDWEPMAKDEAILLDSPPPIEPTSLPATGASTCASTGPATSPSAASLVAQNGPMLLVDSEGNRYFDGQMTLTVVTASGRRRVWALPDQCAGTSDRSAHLVSDGAGHLFLFNAAGRIVRLRETPGEAQPFVVEAVFEDKVPDFEPIQRIWRDPAGRIVVAYGGAHLAVIFPSGQVPREIADKILPQDLKRIDSP